MFEQVDSLHKRGQLSDWVLRAGIAAAFALFGSEKFSAGPGSQWFTIFQQIGLGQWFRYFTGAVEILGGLLVLCPWTASLGLALLACTMAGAAASWVFLLGHPANAIFSGAILVGLALFYWTRRDR